MCICKYIRTDITSAQKMLKVIHHPLFSLISPPFNNISKEYKNAHLLLPCTCVCMLCACLLVKMRGGRTFLLGASCLHRPTVTEITGCCRTDCSWILNWSFWLLWIKNALCHKSRERHGGYSLEGLPCKVAVWVQQCEGRVDKHGLCLIRP